MNSGLILASLLCVLNAPILNAPSSNVQNKEFMNSTDYELVVGNEVILDAHSSKTLPAETIYWTDTFISILNTDEKPNDIWYWVNQSDNETEVQIAQGDWYSVGGDMYFDLPDLSSDTIKGIQFFTKKSLTGEIFWVTTPSLSNTNVSTGNFLPSNSTARLMKTDGSYISINQMNFEKTTMEKGILGYLELKVGSTIIASNSKVVQPTDYTQVTNLLMYNSTYTNELRFSSGYYPRAYNELGYNEDINGYLSSSYYAFVSKDSNEYDTISAPLEVGFMLIGKIFDAMNSFFTFTILPGLTLGVLILIPILFMIALGILKLIKKG